MLEPTEESDLERKTKFIKDGILIDKTTAPEAPKKEPEMKPMLEKASPLYASEEVSSPLPVASSEIMPPSGMSEMIPSQEGAERKEGAMEKDDAYAKILAKVKSSGTAIQSDVSLDAKIASDEADYESKIIKLVEIAETKGVVHAVKVAKHLEDNYLLDELHDRLLATDLHDALVKKGIITEI